MELFFELIRFNYILRGENELKDKKDWFGMMERFFLWKIWKYHGVKVKVIETREYNNISFLMYNDKFYCFESSYFKKLDFEKIYLTDSKSRY